MRIAVLDDYQDAALGSADWGRLDAEVTAIRERLEGEALVERLQPFDVVVLMRERTAFPAGVIDALPSLRLIVTTGSRNAAIDAAAAARRGVPVCGTRSRKPATAQHAMALMLVAARSLLPQMVSMREGGWQTGLGRDLDGLALGVIGLGRLGTEIARLGGAFGMDVLAWSRNLTEERAAEAGARRTESLEALLAGSDVATVHLPLTEGTRGLVGAPELALMRPDAVLVNTSRGPIVDWRALLDTLRSGQLGAAALDVYDEEPLPADHPLRDRTLIDAGRLVLTPHMGYVARATYEAMYADAVEDIEAWMTGEPIRVVEP